MQYKLQYKMQYKMQPEQMMLAAALFALCARMRTLRRGIYSWQSALAHVL